MDAVGGFCEDYFPAYYEDVDLCLSIRALGYRVLCAPRCAGAASRGRQLGSRVQALPPPLSKAALPITLGARPSGIRTAEPGIGRAAVNRAAFRARGCPRRLLVIDDRLPDPTIGSGFGRMRDAIVELPEAGYAVSGLVVAVGISDTFRELGCAGSRRFPGELEAHLREPSVLHDTVVVSRPHNFDRYEALVRECQPSQRAGL